MSVWTHIAANIRFDVIMDNNYENNIKEAFSQDIPEGSEGPLHYEFVPGQGSKSSIAKGSLIIWGDLRDFEDNESIISWINNSILKLKSIYIRQASINIETEGQKSRILYFNCDNECLCEVKEI